jgi:sensor histidine kinase regulating citrate/malate metabolism
MKTNIEFETFRYITDYDVYNLKLTNPSSFNGHVRIHKFKVTVELIEESEEVYNERIQYLWDHCDNHHQLIAIQQKARELNYTLIGNSGSKLTKKP